MSTTIDNGMEINTLVTTGFRCNLDRKPSPSSELFMVEQVNLNKQKRKRANKQIHKRTKVAHRLTYREINLAKLLTVAILRYESLVPIDCLSVGCQTGNLMFLYLTSTLNTQFLSKVSKGVKALRKYIIAMGSIQFYQNCS